MRIKTFWFDLGNVILYFNLRHSFRRLRRFTSVSVREMARYVKEHPTLEADCDTGKVGMGDLYGLLKRDLGLRGLTLRRFKTIWNEIFTPNPSVITLVKRLKRQGYRMILISNTNKMHYEHIQAEYPIVNAFDHHVLSYRLRTRKPSREIFRTALSHSRARPSEIFYIDDRRELTREARRLVGVHGHTFRGIRSLRADLSRKRVRF